MKLSRSGLTFLVLPILAFAVVLVLTPAAKAGDPAQEPDHQAMMTRGSKLMGFDLSKVNHHFYLIANGGVVEITAKDPDDKQTILAIQKHLKEQAKAFEKGNFDIPTQVHGRVPDGVPMMKKLRNEINFNARPNDDGAALRMLTVNPAARESIYEFIRFQINEHHTGDPLQVER